MLLVKRGNGAVKYYSHSDAFESWTVVDLRELSRAPYHDQTTSLHYKIGWNFYNRLQQQDKVNFNDMKLAESFLLEYEDVLDPSTNKPFTTVIWPPTKQNKTVPLLKELPNNSLKDLQFWMYDPITGQAVIVCENTEYRVAGAKDLMRFGKMTSSFWQELRLWVILSMEFVLKTSQLRLLRLCCSSYGQDNAREWKLNFFGLYVGRKLPDL
ncbi:hypothetical protein Hdeb2414_s0012g00384611 [Helianthus debilis subsp. tardiflorus]